MRDARERDVRGKRSDLAAAVGDAAQAQSRLDAARARTQKAREALTAAITARDAMEQPTSTQLTAADRFITRRRHELEALTGEEMRLEAALDERQSAVSGAQRTLARARADREVIERHFERWRQARRIAAERRED